MGRILWCVASALAVVGCGESAREPSSSSATGTAAQALGVPSAITSPATSITTASAILNGTGNPSGEATTGWFRISTTSPGACNDTFGNRVPASGGTDLGSGGASIAYSIATTGLSGGVTYYFCAIVANGSGMAFGGILSFTVPAQPGVTTLAATLVTSTSASLQGSATPNAASSTGWFRYSATSPGTCNDTFGARVPAGSDVGLGSGVAPVGYSQSITGLQPATTYYYCALASNAYGITLGAVLSFTALPALPVVSTGSATSLTGTTVTLNASANPGGDSTTGWFRYSTVSPVTCNDTFGTRVPASGGTSLGNGNNAIAYSLQAIGLSPGTTYYYCAVASNSVGTGYGTVLNFATPRPPAVTTSPASSVTNTTGTLNGQANPNGASASGWFRYASTDPGACNDSFGSRAPITGSSSLGAGTANVGYAQNISGLSAGTTYYFCAIASSAEGISFGAVLTFTTAAPPVTVTTAATAINSGGATLGGSANPSLASSTGWFRYATISPGTCNDSFGTLTVSSSLGSGAAAVPYTRVVTGLLPGTVYYFCAIANNAYDTTFGAVLTFTTLPAAPTVSTSGTSNRTGTSATLSGSVNPGGAATTGWFRLGTVSPGTCNDSFGTRVPLSGGSAVPAGTSLVAFSQAATGLSAGTTYFYCAIAQNSVGTALGELLTFTAPLPPSVTTTAASSVSSTTAQLNGQANPNGATTSGYFRYAATDPGSCNDTFGSRAPLSGGTSLGGSGLQAFAQSISGLSAGTTYYFCAIALSAEGIAFGSVLTFTTTNAPLTTTLPATVITAAGATLNGSANPNLASTTSWYRYATTSPGACNDSFGTLTPSVGLGAGAAAVSYSRVITGLLPGTTYYFCAIANNAFGTAFGAVLTFTTLPAAPAVATGSATNRTGTTATLNASVNPGGDATTGWFRFATTSPGTCNDTFGTRAPLSGGSAIPAGTSYVSIAQAVTGLSPGTVYYYCANAQNSVALTLGDLQTFTTPLPPTVTTSPASSVTNTSAQLNGLANPNGSTTSGYFRYAATDPGTCNDTFGSRSPLTGGTALGGSANQAYGQSIGGLSAGVIYYFCAIASSAEGTSFGAVLSFTTPNAPVTTTTAATLVTAAGATLNGSVLPNLATTTAWFRYATTNPGTCNDSFGTLTSSNSLGAGAVAVPYARAIGSLLPGTSYYVCAIANNAYGTTFGSVVSFTTLPAVPTVSTGTANNRTGTTATLNAQVNPGGDAATGWFRYSPISPGTCNDTFGTRAPTSGGSSIPTGTSTVSISQPITGLSPGTLYYYCANAQNSVGTTLGNLLTFNTPLPPTATTLAASAVTNSTAQLNGQSNPNDATTTAYFRYAATDPGSCNNTFGSRAPLTSGTVLGGTGDQSFAQSISGLSAGVTYYYCAIAQSGEGTAFGLVMSFTTPNVPVTTTSPATLVTSGGATLNGSVTPNLSSTTAWFRYATTSPGTCSDGFGTATTGSSLGAGSVAVAYSRAITSLLPGTTYYFCAIGSNGYGTTFGLLQSFTTLPAAPTAVTAGTSLRTGTTATLNATTNPGGGATTGWFRYATISPGTTCNDTFGTRAPVSGGSSVGAGTSIVSYIQAITGLLPGTLYYYCAITSNSVGTALGDVLTFATPLPPTVTTTAASSVTNSAAYINGQANPNGATTTAWFRYAPTNPGTCDDVFGSRAPTPSGGSALGAGTALAGFQQYISGLSSNQIYYYCAIASSAEGLSFGTVMSFTTAGAPVVTTVTATLVTSSGATMNGTGNPFLDPTYGWFRYSTSNPLVCNDTFGTRVPSSSFSDSYLGTGQAPVDFARALTGLSPGTTYYYCALARNAYGTSLGAMFSFTTLPAAPVVSTQSVTNLNTTTATLNASANPGGATTTGWFRYATISPGSCNDTFGTRSPASNGSPLGGGITAVSYSQNVIGLIPGTTYYACALAQNSVGLTFGAVVSFTTPVPPTVNTLAATPVTATTATLNATVNANGYATTGWFRYGTTEVAACDNVFGTATTTQTLGSSASLVALQQPLINLSPATTYYFCALAQSSFGITLGAVFSLTTPAAPPSVTTLAASAILDTTATLNATVNPNGSATTAWFRYGTTNPGTCNDSFGTRLPSMGGMDLGGGNTTANVNMAVAGLAPGTTYFFCALATSAIGNSVGSPLQFTTANAPATTTAAATVVTGTTATLNGSANSNNSATTAWFRYSTTSPGTCNDTFGTRAPLSSGTALGSGNSVTPFNQALTGLAPGTLYYFCAIAQNAVSTTFGSVLSFTTLNVPTVTTTAATPVASTTATLNASGNPNTLTSTGWFRYSSTDPGACNDAFGTRAPASGTSALGAGNSATPYSQAVTGLVAGTTYYFCGIAQSSAGLGFGNVLSFTTTAAPTTSTSDATLVVSSGATLNGAANPNLSAATGYFRYSPTSPGTCNDTFGTRAPTSGGSSLGSGSSVAAYSQAVTGLVGGTTYYFCAIAQNGVGTTVGTVLSFTTPAAPTVTSIAATVMTDTGATLNGGVNPNTVDATGWFRYSTTNPVTCTDTFGTRAPLSGGTALGAGSSVVTYSLPLTGLVAGTTYYFCALAQSAVGTGVGSVLSFTTPAAPTVTSSAATALASTSATLNGSANPNLSAATGWFRYAATNPGTCDDTFGTRAPASSGTSLGAGSSAVTYSVALTGLSSGTTYYFCAIAQNAVGTRLGSVLSFTTTAAPLVTTVAQSAVTATTATLNGSASPNGSTATGYFRYSTLDPVTCTDTFGTRAPASGGSALGAGTSAVPYTQALTGLTAGATYYYCAIASNAAGLGFGTLLSFTTASAPTVTSAAATAVSSTGATLNGQASPNQLTTTGYFRYSTINPVTCNDTFGTRAPVSTGVAIGAGVTAVAYSQSLTGLVSGATYYFCALASNSVGTSVGTVLSFTTPTAPTVTSVAPTLVTDTSATLNGSANPNGTDATGWFRYATLNPGTCNDTFGTRAPSSGGTALGAGSTVVTYSQALTGLLPATTYYVCALAQSTVGTGVGAVLSFTTPAAPTVTTSAVTALTSTGVTLNGTGDPSRSATTGWFRYSTTSLATCDDTFGTRAPASGGTSLGSGATAVSYSQALTGLLPATTYYFCAIAQNAVGTGYGSVRSFTTLAAPVVTTSAATAVTGTTATLNGAANPFGAATTAWFRYSSVDPSTCNDAFGTRLPSSGGTALGAGSTAVSYSQALTGLVAGTTYYFCALGQNASGTSFGTVLSFSTPVAPAVTTAAATAVSGAAATLNGSANPSGAAATGYFRYSTASPGTCNDTFGTRAPTSSGTALGSGSSAVTYSQSLTGLQAGTTYYFCALAQNASGTGFGSVLSFATPAAPTATTAAATAVGSTGATVNGAASPNGLAATGYFRYSTASPGTCNDTFGTRAPTSSGTALGSGSSAVTYSQSLTGLQAGTTYYFCALAQNASGTGFGSVLSFATPAAPTATTAAATAVSSSSATVNGAASPNGLATTGYFRYSTASPGTCNDTFGTRAPTSSGTALGSGSAAVAFSQALTALVPGATYYFCAIASNSVGSGFGSVLSFTTPAAPTVTTVAPTSVTRQAATLQGTANPNGLAATGWFRFSATNPGACNDTFGTRAPASTSIGLGAGQSAAAYSQSVPGLSTATTYYVCAIASNSVGTSFGAVLSFTTPGDVPSVTTSPPTTVRADSAVLNGSASPNGEATTGWFRYATTQPGTCSDTFGTRTPTTGGTNLGSGAAPVAFSQALTGLQAWTTYYYCALAENAQGLRFGEVVSFVPGAVAPSVTTEPATDLLADAATLSGRANPQGRDATGWFRYGDVSPRTCDDSYGRRAPETGGSALGAGTELAPYTQVLSGLLPNRTYYYCAAASNPAGATFGAVVSFTTGAQSPTVQTRPADVTPEGAVTLRGAANPHGLDATAWFRYATVKPAECNDTFGRRWPAEGGTALGSGADLTAFSEVIAGLPEGAYFYCAVASNEAGAGYGEVLGLTVPAKPNQGGGGCSVDPSGPGGSLVWLGALLLLAVLRRRRPA